MSLEEVRPRERKGVMDLVEHAGVDLSDWANFKGGADAERKVVAICANDHREAHYGQRRDALRVELLALLASVSD